MPLFDAFRAVADEFQIHRINAGRQPQRRKDSLNAIRPGLEFGVSKLLRFDALVQQLTADGVIHDAKEMTACDLQAAKQQALMKDHGYPTLNQKE